MGYEQLTIFDCITPKSVNIKGICDDAYCPECDYPLDELKELDCDICPICGCLLDWAMWHRLND